MNRRGFCSGLGGLFLLPGCRGAPSPSDLPGEAPPERLEVQSLGVGLARVVEVRWGAAVSATGQVSATAVRTMLQAALRELFGTDRPLSSWGRPGARCAIKVNTIASQAFTHPELATELARGLVATGADPARVTVFDRDTVGLEQRGYPLDRTGTSGFRCLGGDDATVGAGQAVTVAGQKVYLSRLLLEADTLISVAALKDHSMAGVSLSLKNNFGLILGAERLHGNVARGSGCEPGISELAALAALRQRLGLAAIDALVGVCDGGPGRAAAEHAFRYAGILLSRDPVALDRRGRAIIEARRAQLGLLPLDQRAQPNPSPTIHIENAAARGVSPV